MTISKEGRHKVSRNRRAFLDRIRSISNDELLEETFDAGNGDDFEGEFTDEGKWEYEALKSELRTRLWMKGFIKKLYREETDDTRS